MAARLKRYSVTGYGQKVVDPKGKFYLVADVLPFVKEAVRTAYNKQSMPCRSINECPFLNDLKSCPVKCIRK